MYVGKKGGEVFAVGGAFLEDTCPAQGRVPLQLLSPRLYCHCWLTILEG